MAKILVADDEQKIRILLSDFLGNLGHTLVLAEDGEKAYEFFLEEEFDVCILDVMMPKNDGWSLCKDIRKMSNVPIIMLTARSEEFDQLHSFDVGADDFISKPFSPSVLASRINALLKRTKGNGMNDLVYDKLVVSARSHSVTKDGEPLDLSPKEYELLTYLMENKGIALSRDQILDSVWGHDFFGGWRTVDTHINRLRIKLHPYEYIKTVRGFGYKIS